MNESNSYRPDVTVIGGGVIGCWAAHYLNQRGCTVTIVERDSIGSGASTGNCGYVCPSHVMPLCQPGAVLHSLPQLLSRKGALSIPLRLDPVLWRWLYRFFWNCTSSHQTHAAAARHDLLKLSMDAYRDFLRHSPIECQWQDAGLMTVHRGQRSFDAFEQVADHLQSEYGIRPDRYDSSQLAEFEPGLIEGLAGGWHFSGDSHLNPSQLMSGLKEKLVQSGVTIRESTEVRCLDVERGRLRAIETSQGRIRSDVFVLATGAESPFFAKPLGCQIPIVPGKGYSMTYQIDASQTEHGPEQSPPPRTPIIFEDSHVAVTPLGDQFRVGSTMQLAGYDRRLDADRIKMIRDDAQTYLRYRLPNTPISTWTGWRPMVHDDLPCIGRSPRVDNTYVASGNGMIGLSTGTGTGKLIAELICGETTSIDAAPFSLKRFSRES
ncbi:NAD(P)/FAD-dependent oxidoreductase [Neorhodopirellula pilleata]|uniref:D-amino acid dehydrogenase small subunit n=1 Tax=Neorhodopirellula pilleata TaxID=2714738 RepID=A0A5C6A4A7_9BACT|nr:FAD-dependent oxidoreductase [Neorhodopirellula pilleata]TWT94225.1 D-amino acid dehydrogenase small subunit [Neorhodopirellula pilleata]